MEIKDSGDRTEFTTGAVRDMQGEDKGRCDLLPLDVVAHLIGGTGYVFAEIQRFVDTGFCDFLESAIRKFAECENRTLPELMLEVSIHYRDGALKYEPNNWKKGIPISSYISSGVRHLLKYIDGQIDERHDRAFVWNMLGAIWTMRNKPEMNDIAGKTDEEK